MYPGFQAATNFRVAFVGGEIISQMVAKETVTNRELGIFNLRFCHLNLTNPDQKSCILSVNNQYNYLNSTRLNC